jgi:hypothetical protein
MIPQRTVESYGEQNKLNLDDVRTVAKIPIRVSRVHARIKKTDGLVFWTTDNTTIRRPFQAALWAHRRTR